MDNNTDLDEKYWSKRKPRHFWEDINNQKAYLTWLGNTLGYKRHEDWYKLRKHL